MAFVNNYNLIVDIKRRLASPVPMFRQDDTARLTFKIYDDGVLFDLTDYSRSDVTFDLPSGQSLVGNAELVGDKIVYNFVGIELVEEGDIKVTLTVYSGNTQVSIQPFIIYAYKRFNSEQGSYIGILQELIVQVTQLEIDVRQAISEVEGLKSDFEVVNGKLETALTEVEGVKTAEANRVIAENGRVTAENERVQRFQDIQDFVYHLESVGQFSLGTKYYKNNIVKDGKGNSYIARIDNTNIPLTDTMTWVLVAEKGANGADGTSLTIKGSLTDASQLPQTGEAGEAYSVNGELYVWSVDSNSWINIGNIKGEKGDKGDLAELRSYDYTVSATSNGQTTVEIPLESFVASTDVLFLILNGTTLYDTTDYTISGRTVTLKEPIADYTKATFFIRIFKNVPTGTNISIHGSLIIDGTIPREKLDPSLTNELDMFYDTQIDFSQHIQKVASNTELGHVMLVNDLTTGGITKALTAEQGKVLFQSVSDGKALVASAITGKGVTTASDATFQQMATNITAIPTSGSGGTNSYRMNNQKPTGVSTTFSEYIDRTKSKTFKYLEYTVSFEPTTINAFGNIINSGVTIRVFHATSSLLTDTTFENGKLVKSGAGFVDSVYYNNSTKVTSSIKSDLMVIKAVDNENGTYTVRIPILTDATYLDENHSYNIIISE